MLYKIKCSNEMYVLPNISTNGSTNKHQAVPLALIISRVWDDQLHMFLDDQLEL
jgi:hypothetical protein